MVLALDEGFGRFPLGVQRIEFELESLISASSAISSMRRLARSESPPSALACSRHAILRTRYVLFQERHGLPKIFTHRLASSPAFINSKLHNSRCSAAALFVLFISKSLWFVVS